MAYPVMARAGLRRKRQAWMVMAYQLWHISYGLNSYDLSSYGQGRFEEEETGLDGRDVAAASWVCIYSYGPYGGRHISYGISVMAYIVMA